MQLMLEDSTQTLRFLEPLDKGESLTREIKLLVMCNYLLSVIYVSSKPSILTSLFLSLSLFYSLGE